MKVSIFITCLADIFYPEVGKDVVEILEDLGCEVDFPKDQTCCGQPAYNSGYQKETKTAAKHVIEAFAGAEYVVAPSGSCVMMVHEFSSLFSETEARDFPAPKKQPFRDWFGKREKGDRDGDSKS